MGYHNKISGFNLKLILPVVIIATIGTLVVIRKVRRRTRKS